MIENLHDRSAPVGNRIGVRRAEREFDVHLECGGVFDFYGNTPLPTVADMLNSPEARVQRAKEESHMSIHPSWLCSDCTPEKCVDCALMGVREDSEDDGGPPHTLTFESGDISAALAEPVEAPAGNRMGDGYQHPSGALASSLPTVADIISSPEAQVQREFAMEQAVKVLIGDPKPRHTYEILNEVRAGLDAEAARLVGDLRAIDLTQVEGKSLDEIKAMLHSSAAWWPDEAMNRVLDDMEEEIRMDDESVARQMGRAFRRGVVAGALAAVAVVVVWAAGDRAR